MPIALHKDQELAAHWKTQIELCDKELRRFRRRGKKIAEKYRDDRDETSDGDRPDYAGSKRSLNLFWSNVQTLKPAIYSRCPVPICERRFKDKDTTGRVASTILERALRYEVQMSGFHTSVRKARDDYLLPGRGTVWIRYNPQFGPAISPKVQADDEINLNGVPEDIEEVEQIEEQERELEAESIAVDYLHWQDYYTFPPKARTEEEIEGKGRRIYMSRQDLIDKFGEKDGKAVPLDHAPNDSNQSGAQSKSQVNDLANQATIFEIWWKPERKVYFIAKEYDKCLIPKGVEADGDGIPDPLRLEGFFPCPPPLNATMTNDTLIPVPDYVEAQDQYMQIDDLTKRIDILTNACKVRGAYDASAQGVKRIFEEGQEPDLIPIDSWAMFAEKGGLRGAIDWVPLDAIAVTLKTLIEVRQEIMNDLDRVTGINDINRGTSDARETLGGVRIKQNNVSGRLAERQDEMARFCRDIICIMGEIISELYSPETLIQVSGAMYDEGLEPPPLPAPQPLPGMASPTIAPVAPDEDPQQKEQRKLQMFLDAIGLLKSDKLRGFRIDIETDSTIQGDAEQEKQARIEFVEGVTKFVETAATVTQGVPEFAPLAAKMIQFAVRGFRVGRDLEAAIEEFSEKAELQAKTMANQPKPPSADQVKAQTEQMKAKAEIAAQQIEAESEKQNKQLEYQIKMIDLDIAKIKAAAETRKAQIDTETMERERQAAIEEHGRKTQLALTEHNNKLAQMGEVPNTAASALGQQLNQLTEHVKQLGTMLSALHQHAMAPVEFKRGFDGKVQSVKKGGVERKVHRGADGKAIALQ